MLPWGHLAVGYLVYTVYTRVRHRRPPGGAATLVLAVATQLPDVVDKPANWWFGILDGRGIGHSLLVVLPVCALVVVLARRRDRPALGTAFAVGTIAHLLGDALSAILAGQVRARASYLLWPLWEAPRYPRDSLFDHLRDWMFYVEHIHWYSPLDLLSSWFGLQVAAFLSLLAIWAVDGFPGLRLVWGQVAELVRPSPG